MLSCRRAARTVPLEPDGPAAAVDPGWPTGRRPRRTQYAGAPPYELDPAPRQDRVERALHHRSPGAAVRPARSRQPERDLRQRGAGQRRAPPPARGRNCPGRHARPARGSPGGDRRGPRAAGRAHATAAREPALARRPRALGSRAPRVRSGRSDDARRLRAPVRAGGIHADVGAVHAGWPRLRASDRNRSYPRGRDGCEPRHWHADRRDAEGLPSLRPGVGERAAAFGRLRAAEALARAQPRDLHGAGSHLAPQQDPHQHVQVRAGRPRLHLLEREGRPPPRREPPAGRYRRAHHGQLHHHEPRDEGAGDGAHARRRDGFRRVRRGKA